MPENKTKPTRVSVAAFLKKAATGQQLKDCQELVKLFSELTGKPAKMWGPSIVGFGSYHYVYESGREGDAPLIGFSPRKPKLVLYVMSGLDDKEWRANLGKFKVGVSCLYIKTLDDIDRELLKKVARSSIAEVRKRYAASQDPVR
jgi:hypothetical protein